MLVLASASQGRLELLSSIGIEPDRIVPADIDETPLKKELPRNYVLRLAEQKAEAVSQQCKDCYIIAGDSVAVLGRDIIGKAESPEEAKKIIKRFSGRRHRLISGVCVIAPDGRKASKFVSTFVKFSPLSNHEIDKYIQSGEWKGKSGCFSIQGLGGGFVQSINGSYSNVVGLPLVETKNLLFGLGFKLAL